MSTLHSTLQSAVEDQLILRILDSSNQLDPDKLEDWINNPNKDEGTLEESLIRAGLATEELIATAYANHYLMPVFDPPADAPPPVDPEIANILPSRLCRDHLIAPLSDLSLIHISEPTRPY